MHISDLWSDRLRWGKIALLGGVVILLCAYNLWYAKRELHRTQEMLSNPAGYQGNVFSLSYIIVVEQTSEYHVLYLRGMYVKAVALGKEVVPHQTISMRGILEANGRLRVVTYHVHDRLRWKIYLSLIPLLVVFGLFLKYFTIDWRRLIIQPR